MAAYSVLIVRFHCVLEAVSGPSAPIFSIHHRLKSLTEELSNLGGLISNQWVVKLFFYLTKTVE